MNPRLRAAVDIVQVQKEMFRSTPCSIAYTFANLSPVLIVKDLSCTACAPWPKAPHLCPKHQNSPIPRFTHSAYRIFHPFIIHLQNIYHSENLQSADANSIIINNKNSNSQETILAFKKTEKFKRHLQNNRTST